jgi:hypothetical protein
MTSVHGSVSGLTTRIGNMRQKLYTGSSFSSPDLFNDLHTEVIN